MSLWLVRAGRYGGREDFALENNVVAIGWDKLPDLSRISSRKELEELCKKTYPEAKPNTIRNWLGQLWSFRERIHVDDLVVLPLEARSAIAVGRVTSPYQYKTDFPPDARHTRSVKWLRTDLPRTAFDQDLLCSLGAFSTVCQIKRNNAENRVIALLAGKVLPVEEKDEAEPGEALDFEQPALAQIREHVGRIYFSIFRFHILARDGLPPEPFMGGILRGGFGMALKRLACLQRRATCDTCLLRRTCVYLQIFESPRLGDCIAGKSTHDPHGFVLEPPLNAEASIGSGKMSFNLILIGKNINYLPYFILSFKYLGEIGLGTRRQRFQITAVENLISPKHRPIIYSESAPSIERKPHIVNQAKIKCESESLSQNHVTLLFLTPTRIKQKATPTASDIQDKTKSHLIRRELDFPIFLRSLLRRLSWLAETHCGEKWDLDYQRLLNLADRVRTTFSDLGWYDWERYSKRQNSKLKMGGFVGHVKFEGELGEFLPFIKMGEYLHIGQGTAFGLGKYIILG